MHFFLLKMWSLRLVKIKLKLIRATIKYIEEDKVFHGLYTSTHQRVCVNIALRPFLHSHGNIATEGSPKPGLCPTLISNDFKGSS